MMNPKYSDEEFDKIVNDELRDNVTEETKTMLRTEEYVYEWKYSLRRILGSLRGTRATKLADIIRDASLKEDYYRWVSKTEWFWAVVENRLDEATRLSAQFCNTTDARIASLEDDVDSLFELLD